jgi:hypothetical protein
MARCATGKSALKVMLRILDDLREPATRGTLLKVIEVLKHTTGDVKFPPTSLRPVIERLATMALDAAAIDAAAAAAAAPDSAVLMMRALGLLLMRAWCRWHASARRSTSTLLASVIDAYLRPLLPPPSDARAAQPSLALLPPAALLCAAYALNAGLLCFEAGAPLSFEHTWRAALRVMQCRDLVAACSSRFAVRRH